MLAADRVEWILKLNMLEKFRDRHGFSWASPKMRTMDRLFDDTGPKGIGMKHRQGVWSKWMPPEKLIVERMSAPSQTARGKIRGEYVVAFAGIEDVGANWGGVSYLGTRYPMGDPHATSNEKIAELIKKYGNKQAAP